MTLSDVKKEYDIVVAGGGVTGAGVFYEAVIRGFKVLLLEAEDFAWGTSSRSSKMVHGGLRYLKQGKFFLTKAAVKEREGLLKRYPGLVTPLDFIMPVYDHYGPSGSSMKIGLSLYSFMAGEKQHKCYTGAGLLEEIPKIRRQNLVSAAGFKDAQVDDARLVLRLIFDACRAGGHAINYAKVAGIERDQKKRMAAVHIVDKASGVSREVKTKVLINATGAFAETLHPSPVKGYHIRPLRGSHLIFPGKLFPLNRAVSFIHPQDLRPTFLFPWEGSIVLGTTDVDHDQSMNSEPRVSKKEADYLLEGLHYILPGLDFSLDDCISSMAGVRPVLSRKNRAASKESREHVVWKDKGLITVTGGKLTTFRLLANDALKAAGSCLPKPEPGNISHKTTDQFRNTLSGKISKQSFERLHGRYGTSFFQMIQQYDKNWFAPIENTTSVWAEIRQAVENERVHHLSDLLLRRVRIGLFLPRGGVDLLNEIESRCSPYLSWNRQKWEIEKNAYVNTWETCYSPPKKEPKEQKES